jgi:hypothetical protein
MVRNYFLCTLYTIDQQQTIDLNGAKVKTETDANIVDKCELQRPNKTCFGLTLKTGCIRNCWQFGLQFVPG